MSTELGAASVGKVDQTPRRSYVSLCFAFNRKTELLTVFFTMTFDERDSKLKCSLLVLQGAANLHLTFENLKQSTFFWFKQITVKCKHRCVDAFVFFFNSLW